MYSFTDLQLFVLTADCGSLSKAARKLDLLPATASASLKRLEQRLGGRLFIRSTRSLRLTQEGEIFLDYCRNALNLLHEGESLLMAGKNAVRGHIRVSAPSDLGRKVLLPWFNLFQQTYPEITLSLQFSDRVIDLIREPIDLAFRYGKMEDSTLISQPVINNSRVVVASPSYIAKHGKPETPQELTHHNCLLYYLKPGLLNVWRFYSGKENLEIKVRGNRIADDGWIVREWAIAGEGIAYKSLLDLRQDIEEGKLIPLLQKYTGEPSPLNVVYPDRNSTSSAVRALIAFVRTQFEKATVYQNED